MADQNIPAGLAPEEAKAAREWATDYLKSGAGSERVRAAARVVLATVPAPPRPTLADMTPEERAACRRMQADVADHDTRYVITDPSDEDGEVALIDPDGGIKWIFPEYVTPRPDLPRLEWPGDQKAALEETPESEEEFMANIEKALDDHYGPLPAPAPALPDGWRLADHREYGRGIVTNTTLTRAGRVYFVIPADDPMGYDWFSCSSDDLTYLDQEADQ